MKTMKNLTLKLAALLLVFFFAANAVDAQVANGDYVQYSVDLQTPGEIDYVTLKTGNTIMGYYALPDPVYHPNYDDVMPNNWDLTADFVWDWTVAPVMATAKPGAANYVQITFTATGDYDVTVSERAPALFGGCFDTSPTEMVVRVINPPTAAISILPGGSWQEIDANESYQICGDQLAQLVTVTFTEDVPGALASYSFQVSRTVERIDGLGNVTGTPTPEAVIQDFPVGTKLKGTFLGVLTGAAFSTSGSDHTFTFNTTALPVDIVPDAARTKYTYKVTRSGDLIEDDFKSAISHKSDYIAGDNFYAFTTSEVSFIVNPSPATGPIYHIPNNFRY